MSRQFAFMGFKGEGDAERAIKRFNRSFMGTFKLTVEPAKEIGDNSVLQRAWSKHTKAKEEAKKVSDPSKSKTADVTGDGKKGAKHARRGSAGEADDGMGDLAGAAAKDIKNKDKLAEYLALSRPRNTVGLWANDDAQARKPIDRPGHRRAAPADGAAGEDAEGGAAAAADDDGNSTDSEEYQVLPGSGSALRIGGDTAATKKGGVAEVDEEDDDEEEPQAQRGKSGDDDEEDDDDANDKSKSHAKKSSALSDLDFLKSKVKKNFDDDDNSDSGSGFSDDADDDDGDASRSTGSSHGGSDDEDDGDADGGAMTDDSDGEEAKPRKQAASKSKVAVKAAGADAGDVEMRVDDEPDGNQRPPSKPTAPAVAAPEAAAQEPEIDLAETGRLFVRNLPYACTEEDLRSHFGKWGPLADVKLPVDANGKQKGFAYITFMMPEQAITALSGSDGKVFQGRILHVLPAKPPAAETSGNPNAGTNGGDGDAKSSYKTKKEAERRAAAGNENEQKNVWNSLFIRGDTTISAMAEKLNVSRGDVLDRDSKNMAVRMALAETQLIAETKEFLNREGISIPTLEQALQSAAASGGRTRGNSTSAAGTAAGFNRSDCVILVKNVPYTAEGDALKELFARHGTLLRFVMPPSRALAVVEYSEPKSAKRAFSTLAYARFQRVPLYLEWAPEQVFTSPAPAVAAPAPAPAPKAAPAASAPTAAGAASAAEAGKKRKREEDTDAAASASSAAIASAAMEAAVTPAAGAGGDDGSGAPSTDGRTVFVKNLAFATTEDGLQKMFAQAGPVRSVRIPKRRNPKYKPAPAATVVAAGAAAGASAAAAAQNAEWLSMGYGFVEFVSKEDAERALRNLQGKMLDAHALQLKISIAKVGAGAAAPSKSTAKAAASSSAASANGKPDAKAMAKAAAGDATSTKLVVRNLAFEATKNDVQELFTSFGSVKSVRLPKKFDGSHRGFAFVEFLTHSEAVTAMESLAATHLYGRHLVIEWAAAAADNAGDAGVGATK